MSLIWEKVKKEFVLNAATLFLIENIYLVGVRIVTFLNQLKREREREKRGESVRSKNVHIH